MLGIIDVNHFDNKDFAIVGTIKSFDLEKSVLQESKLFPGAMISPCLKSDKGYRAHLVYPKGAKQSLIYRTCDLEFVVLSGSIKISCKNGSSQVLKSGSYTQIPAKTAYSLLVLEETVLFVMGAKRNIGMDKVDLNVEVE
jgi:mannose-6-phosphate isomerase-like protein (cupin superfamily)